MSMRSVIETLDLHDDYGEYHSEVCASQSCGWLSPRISFSTDFISGSSDKLSPDKHRKDEGHSDSPDFEFSMPSVDILDTASPSFIVPADELFHKGKLLPGFISPCQTIKGVECTLPGSPDSGPLENQSVLLNSEMKNALSPLGCVLGPSCARTSKGTKWRELFGALRRVKSDSGRQRIPDQNCVNPKSIHGRKKFFKQLFSGRHNSTPDSKLSKTECSPASSSCVSNGFLSGSQDMSSNGDSLSTVASREALLSAAFPDFASVSLDSQHSSADISPELYGSQVAAKSRGKILEPRPDDFSFNPLPGRTSSTGTRLTSSSSGRSSPIKFSVNRGSNLTRSGSGRVIVRGLDRVSSGRNSALQEQLRALRAREIRRSPERTGYSNVRVTPVLNVPVCMGPVLRGATKVGKGRLSNFRSFLTFKSKLPTSLAAPIATR